jgi:ferredoxin
MTVIKDLVVDLEPDFEKVKKVKPYIIRDVKEIYETDEEFGQKPEELEKYYNFAYCIQCGLCMAACPILATNDNFLGPMALNAAYRWSADSRDQGWRERAKIIDSEDGVWPCHLAQDRVDFPIPAVGNLYSRLTPSTSAVILILSNFAASAFINSASPSITFTTYSLPSTSTLPSKPSSVREPLALPSSTISLAFCKPPRPPPRPLEYVLHELRRQLPCCLSRAVYGEPCGVRQALPTDIHVARAALLRHLHREVSPSSRPIF